MIRPPLDVTLLFAEAVPRREDLAPQGMPLFTAYAGDVDGDALHPLLEDVDQPLEPFERLAAARARVALHLRCDADLHPARRLPGCVRRIRQGFELGAVAVVVPAAHKVLGPRAFARAVGGDPARLFVHRHIVDEDGEAWLHTHGMEHFALPDLEVRSSWDVVDRARALLAEGVNHLLRHEGVMTADGWHLSPAPPRANHAVGAHGVLRMLARTAPLDHVR